MWLYNYHYPQSWRLSILQITSVSHTWLQSSSPTRNVIYFFIAITTALPVAISLLFQHYSPTPTSNNRTFADQTSSVLRLFSSTSHVWINAFFVTVYENTNIVGTHWITYRLTSETGTVKDFRKSYSSNPILIQRHFTIQLNVLEYPII